MAVFLSLLLVALALAACGGGGGDGSEGTDGDGSGGDSKTVVFSVYSDEPLFIRSSIKGLEEAAAEKGWDFQALVGDNDPVTQVGQIESVLPKEPDALILWPNDTEAVVPVARQAVDQGVEVVTMGQDISDTSLRDFYVGPHYDALGARKAEALADEIGGKGKVAIIRGIQGADFTEKLASGGDPVFEKAPGVDVVDEQYIGSYTTADGLKAAENILTAHPDLDGIWTDSDDQAVGALQALEQRGLVGKVAVVSTNGDPVGLEEVEEGRMAYTQALCGVEDGHLLMNGLEALLNGEDPGADAEDFLETKVVDVTPETIDEHTAYLSKCN